jgi:hypothetical protein
MIPQDRLIPTDGVRALSTNTTAFGLTTLSDNHGNSVRGNLLTCQGTRPVRLSLSDWSLLYTTVRSFIPLQNASEDRNISIPGNMESPLQWMCREREAAERQRQR